MKLVVASEHQPLSLALQTQMPGYETRGASSVATALSLADPDAIILIDLGATRGAEWVEQLRDSGLENAIVLIDAVEAELVAAPPIVHLVRPFSLEQLVGALQTASRDSGSNQAVDPSNACGEPTEVVGASVGEETADEVSAAPSEQIATQQTPGDEDDGIGAAPPPSPSATSSVLKRRRPGIVTQWLRRTASARAASPEEHLVVDGHERVRRGLAAALVLEALLNDLSIISDVAACGQLLLEEIREVIPVGSSAVALRGAGGDLELVAAGGTRAGATDGHLALMHPFVRAVESQGGTLLLSPTDSVRGMLAGVPMSHWPTLLAVTIPGQHQLDGIVLVGHQDPPAADDIDRLSAAVAEASDLLRLTAILRRLPRPDGAQMEFLHSWMR